MSPFLSICLGLALALPPAPFLLADTAASTPRDPLPRWRGNNVAVRVVTPELITRLASLHVNALRINFDTDSGIPAAERKAPTPDDPLAPYAGNLRKLDAILPLCRAHGIQVTLAASGIYGRKIDVFWSASDGLEYRNHLVHFWSAISERYKDEPALVAYDILNEPTYNGPDEARGWWDDLLPRSIAAIRRNDATIWFVVEPGPWGLPGGFKSMPLIDDSRVVYSFHHYLPHAYTHQGVSHINKPTRTDTRGLYVYPGESPTFENETDNSHWDLDALERTMQPVIDFQARHPDVRIYVGEFGVIRWAEGSNRWIADSIAIFEKHGWDWTFHAVGEWNGWDPSYAPNAPISQRPADSLPVETPSFHVLKQAWLQNIRPNQ
jgi:endoglucanase